MEHFLSLTYNYIYSPTNKQKQKNMGFFSWKTSDTKRSIPNVYSSKKPFTVHLITEDGQIFTETEYDGYGVFGGKDFYSLVAELNGIKEVNEDKLRVLGIDLCFKDNPSGEYNGTFKYPKLVENLPEPDFDWKKFWDSINYPVHCEYQGYFYDDNDDNYDEDDDY